MVWGAAVITSASWVVSGLRPRAMTANKASRSVKIPTKFLRLTTMIAPTFLLAINSAAFLTVVSGGAVTSDFRPMTVLTV